MKNIVASFHQFLPSLHSTKRSPTHSALSSKPSPPYPTMKKPATATATATATAKLSPTPPITPPQPTKKTKTPLLPTWAPLNLPKSELSLPLTLPTGQTFRWKQTSPPNNYTGPIGPHLISLKHQNDDVFFLIHSSPSHSSAKSALLHFLNSHISLSSLWAHFSRSDPRFLELSRSLTGARVLRQDPVECLFQFLCSSNNNIARITKMVDYLSSLGDPLGEVGGFRFYQFPSLERLAAVSEDQLRGVGFGYRAKYITGTVEALRSKPGGGAKWLESLRELELPVVIDELCSLPGVGPKVAACVALFSLDQHHAIPVDTHVWQIATKYILPELASARLTPKLCSHIAEVFVSKYGKYAGWAQTLLFIAELPSQKAILPSDLLTSRESNSAKRKDREADDAI